MPLKAQTQIRNEVTVVTPKTQANAGEKKNTKDADGLNFSPFTQVKTEIKV